MPPAILSSRARRLRAGIACAVLLALAGYLVAHLETGGSGPPRCVARTDGASVALDPEQGVNAATIAAVASARGLPERAVTIALATAMQESGLRNIRRGDRDSLGLFQQRPSQGWGSARQILDPVYSTGAFYDHLVRVPGYSRLPLTVAAQRVQRSGYPQAYAKHETDAAVLTDVLTGRTAGAFTCPGPPDDGKAGDVARVRARLVREFGPEVLPDGAGPAGGGEHAGGGRDVVLPVPAVPDAGGGNPDRRGWELAHWAVAHSDGLRIERVSYRGRVWSAAESGKGWRTAEGISGAEVRISVAQ
ncbi:hypothetical protein [Streptomyces sp. XD-27]|uniref:hypothetical protein n=1 Tax=Streptomyces sp. XD-27 TaxID=3062779 RepID=UPI0026F42B91|nr:hypothetical protein [Streptomyces sp. XD-27]WKX72422.1 hypothetical protein Q3Y56_23200 [Streptomyces sp. XD-27]